MPPAVAVDESGVRRRRSVVPGPRSAPAVQCRSPRRRSSRRATPRRAAFHQPVAAQLTVSTARREGRVPRGERAEGELGGEPRRQECV